jgi:hypothetical protein
MATVQLSPVPAPRSTFAGVITASPAAAPLPPTVQADEWDQDRAKSVFVLAFEGQEPEA